MAANVHAKFTRCHSGHCLGNGIFTLSSATMEKCNLSFFSGDRRESHSRYSPHDVINRNKGAILNDVPSLWKSFQWSIRDLENAKENRTFSAARGMSLSALPRAFCSSDTRHYS